MPAVMAASLRNIHSLTGFSISVTAWHHARTVGSHGAVLALSDLVGERPEAFAVIALVYDTRTLALGRSILAHISESDGAKGKRGVVLRDVISSTTTTPRVPVVRPHSGLWSTSRRLTWGSRSDIYPKSTTFNELEAGQSVAPETVAR